MFIFFNGVTFTAVPPDTLEGKKGVTKVEFVVQTPDIVLGCMQ